jgi:hypothetical protein
MACDAFFQEQGEWNEKNESKNENSAYLSPLL